MGERSANPIADRGSAEDVVGVLLHKSPRVIREGHDRTERIGVVVGARRPAEHAQGFIDPGAVEVARRERAWITGGIPGCARLSRGGTRRNASYFSAFPIRMMSLYF